MNKLHWHPAFCGATEWELRGNKQNLSFEAEHTLSKEPLRMDLLIIRKDPAAVIQNEIGKIFRTFNIVEFKGSGDSLTLMREAYPRELFKTLERSGVKVSEKYQGIYYLTGKVLFPTQIIVIKELDNKHAALRILSSKARREDIKAFLQDARLAKEPGDLENIDAVLQVSVSANKNLYKEVREENDKMCQALEELMQDVIEEKLNERESNTRLNTRLVDIRALMKNTKMTAEQAMKALGIPAKERPRYSALL